ncbi:hypothetical protein C0989_003076 [Termitomyces sp. Mn162]|nr:hypothetical protein C0989_003076 [Termitomyces sp. Mn162]
MQYIWDNGVDEGQNNYIRVPPNNNPVTDVTSTDLTCNVNGLSGAGVSTLSIAAGTNITFEWHQHDQRTGEDPISGGHKGPVQVYIAKAPGDASSFNGQGAVWTKIYSSGLLTANPQLWATDVVNSNGGEPSRITFPPILHRISFLRVGKHSVVIPSSLPAGQYLIRAEIVRFFQRYRRQVKNIDTSIDRIACGNVLPWSSILHRFVLFPILFNCWLN